MSVTRYGTFVFVDSFRKGTGQPVFGMLLPLSSITGVRAPERDSFALLSYLDAAGIKESDLAFAADDFIALCEALGTASMLNKIAVTISEETYIGLMQPQTLVKPVN